MHGRVSKELAGIEVSNAHDSNAEEQISATEETPEREIRALLFISLDFFL